MMCFSKGQGGNYVLKFIYISFLFPALLFANTRTWTGYGGDKNWSNPFNWSGAALPQSTDDILLDNRDIPVSFLINLPDSAVIVRTIIINPSPGRNIELVLPVTNKITNALTVTGPGYGIELKDGAIFRNASGLSSGESLFIADSMIIHDGARYIHQTRASHANNIVRLLSVAPGTELGTFDFDVPRASYTISISNRIYGSLELHAGAFGSVVNYTGSGANPLLVRGNLRIGPNVNISMALSGANGNAQVEGDFIQEGGQLNLASGSGVNTVLRVRGDLHQSAEAIITKTSLGNPFLELNGIRVQEIEMAGRLMNHIGFRMNNKQGSLLKTALVLPWKLEMNQGAITSTASSLLVLDSGCTISIDSSRVSGSYINGPLRKLALNQEDHFLFPVGKDENLRWLELKEAKGNYTVEYMHQNPASFNSMTGPGLDHISKLEYWTIVADGVLSDHAKIELSFGSVQSGGVTDPAYLNVAKFQTTQWVNAGHSGITGNFIQGSIISENTDFAANFFTLASTLNMENPLPLTNIDLVIMQISGKPVFRWTIETPETPDHFDLYEQTGSRYIKIAEIPAQDKKADYSWTSHDDYKDGNHYFQIKMTDIYGNEYMGKLVLYKIENSNTRVNWISAGTGHRTNQVLIQSENPDIWKYEIFSMDGRCMKNGTLSSSAGFTIIPIESTLTAGIYIFRAIDSHGKKYCLQFQY
jgi:hypothetical protein